MSADFSRLLQHLADGLEQHADRDGLTGVRRAVYLARGGHAPGDPCPTEAPADPPDTPDLRTLATVAAHDVDCPDGPNCREDLTTYGRYGRYADAVLAAVLPAHRRQVLDQAAEACSEREDEAGRTYQRDVALDSTPTTRRESAVRQRTWRVAKELLRELASAAPETAPRPRQDDETAPAVGREAAEAQGATEAAMPDGPRTWQLPDEPGPAVTAVRNAAGGTWDREGDGWRYRTSGRVPGVVGSWRRWDGLLITEGTLTDATPPDGQDGDGHG